MKKNLTTKSISKSINILFTSLLQIQIERENFNSRLQHLASYSVPLFLAIFNSSYTLQADIFQNTQFSIVFDFFLYMTPNRLLLTQTQFNYSLISGYVLVALPTVLLSAQMYYKTRNESYSYWITYSINIVFPAVFRGLLLPILNILMWSIKIFVFPDQNSQVQGSLGLACASFVFLLGFLVETGAFLLFFCVNSFKARKLHFFACLNLEGEFFLMMNSCLMALTEVVLGSKEVWQNLLRVFIHGAFIHTVVMKQPYYNTKTNISLVLSYLFSMTISVGYLVSYNIQSATFTIFMIFFVYPLNAYLLILFFQRQRKKITKKVLKEINFDWEIHFIALHFIENFDKAKKNKTGAALEDLINSTIHSFELFLQEKIKCKSETLPITILLLTLYLNRPEHAYTHIFLFSLQNPSTFSFFQMKKLDIQIKNYKILEEFYSNYFILSTKCKKYDLAVCKSLLKLSSELHKNFPNLSKIIRKLKILITSFKKCLNVYSSLMKDYQSQENLELYGSFLTNILKDPKGSNYLTLANNISSDLMNDTRGFWLLNNQTGFCVFSANSIDCGTIFFINQQFLDILHLNKEIASENVLDLVYGTFAKVAQELMGNKLRKINELEVVKDCFRCFVDYEEFFVDVDLMILPTEWKGEKRLLLAIRPVNEILIVIDKELNIVNVSRNFVSKVLGSSNKISVFVLLQKKITYFLPNFKNLYKENSVFVYEIWNMPDQMEIRSKTFKYKELDYVFLSISNFSRNMFRQNSVVESIRRKHSLTIVQITEADNYSKQKIAQNITTVANKESVAESKKYDYEPESFSLSKRAKKDNIEVFKNFSQRNLLIKVFLFVLYLFSLVSMIGGLVFLVYYVNSFKDSSVISDYSNMLQKVLEITINARYLYLVNSGYIPNSYELTYKEYLFNSTQDLSALLDSVKSNSLIKNNEIFVYSRVNLLSIAGNSVISNKVNLQEALLQFTSNSEQLYTSSQWQQDKFMFIFLNGQNYLIEKFFESIHIASQEFITAKLYTQSLIIIVIMIPQLFLYGLMCITLFPQMFKVGRIYKQVLREISRLKQDKLIAISETVVKRLSVYHKVTREVKRTTRNSKPIIKKRWKLSAVCFTLAVALYSLASNLLLTVPASNLNSMLQIYTSEGLMTINCQLYLSSFWLLENFLSYSPYSYETLVPQYLTAADIPSKVYKADSIILQTLSDLRLNIADPASQQFLLNNDCDSNTYCSDYMPGGLAAHLKDIILDNEYGITVTLLSNNSIFLSQYQKILNLNTKINNFRTICSNYTGQVLENWNFVAIGVVLNLLFGFSLLLIHKLTVKQTLTSIIRFATFRIFYAENVVNG